MDNNLDNKLDNNCIFCKIIKGEVPSEKVYETEDILVFKSIEPVTKIHDLVIPKKHISNLQEMNDEDKKYYLEKIYDAIQEVARIENIAESGYRVVTNVLEDGGQSVMHIHFHVLGGEKLQDNL